MTTDTILIGDIHFGKKGFNKDQYSNQISFFHKQLFPYILENNIKRVICMGDFFDHQTRQDVELLLDLREDFFDFFEENSVEFINIIGNHDIYYKHSRKKYTLDLYKNYKYLTIIDTPTLLELGKTTWELVPWILKDEIYEPKSNYIMGHFEINGFYMVSNYKCNHGISASSPSLKNMQKVISGHFHLKQNNDSIFYLGTPYSLDWNDINTDKGFYLLELDNSLTFIDNKINKRFYKVIEKNSSYYINDKEISKLELDVLMKYHNVSLVLENMENAKELKLSDNTIIQVEDNEQDVEENTTINDYVKSNISEKAYKEYDLLYQESLQDN